MKKVLFIAYYFPPAGGGGVQRPTKFVKYLPQFGWEPVVLTATEDSFVETDESLSKDIPPGTAIERVRPFISKKQTFKLRSQTGAVLTNNQGSKSMLTKIARFMRNWVMIPDSQIFWVIPAIFRLRGLLRKHKPNVIFATAPPYSVFLLGLAAKWLSQKPLVSDFRDPWTEWLNTLRNHEPGFRKKIERWMEKIVVRNSNYVLSPTRNMASYFQNKYSESSNSKYGLIYNGYDDDDFKGIQPKKFKNFAIVYTGKIIPDMYSALPFLKAFGQMLRGDPDLRYKVEVHFVGAFEDQKALDFIKEESLTGTVRIHGYLPHSESLSFQMGANLLLLLQNPGAIEGITGKIFEYLKAKKPILAIIPQKSAALEILSEANIRDIVAPDSPDLIAEKIRDLITSSSMDVTPKVIPAIFNRKHQAQELSAILDTACA